MLCATTDTCRVKETEGGIASCRRFQGILLEGCGMARFFLLHFFFGKVMFP